MKSEINAENANKVCECPIEFRWGTFCEQVWMSENRRTLVDIRPNRTYQVGFAHGAPKRVNLNLGDFDVFCVLDRKPGVKGDIEETITFTTNFIPEEREQVVKMESKHKTFSTTFGYRACLWKFCETTGIRSTGFGLSFGGKA
jgi:hypothetical protein